MTQPSKAHLARDQWGLAALAALFFLPFLGGVHLFDWDEINFAEIAREMKVTGNWLAIQMNYLPFTEKPPFFFWLQAAGMEVFGVGEYAARFPNALAGIIAIPLLYRLGRRLRDRRFGLLWALGYFGSILPNLYFRSGIIDPWFNLFIFLGLHHLILFSRRLPGSDNKQSPPVKLLLLAGLFTGLGILTKGPVAYLITGIVLAVYWVSVRFRFFIKPLSFLGYTVIALGVTGVWFGLETLLHGPAFILEFTERQWALFSTPDAGHGGFPGYHFVVILLGCFPISVWALPALFRRTEEEKAADYLFWMKILFWVVLILFTIVKSKIIHYSSLAYYPLSFIAAWQLHAWIEGRSSWSAGNRLLLIILAVIIAGVSLFIPYMGLHMEDFLHLFQADPFALENMEAEVSWTGYEGLIGVFLLMITVFAVFILYPRNRAGAFYSVLGATSLWVFLTLIFYVAKIEGYSQRAAVEFFEAQQGKEVYVKTFGYKSYAHLFYARVMPAAHNFQEDPDWVLYGEVDRPVYISCKVTHREELEKKVPDARFLGHKNGFYFYLREPVK